MKRLTLEPSRPANLVENNHSPAQPGIFHSTGKIEAKRSLENVFMQDLFP